MFGFFKKKRAKKAAAAPVQPVSSGSAGDSSIPYQSDLIEEMKSEHVSLLDLYTDIKMASEMKNFKKVSTTLKEFRGELEDHLIKENVSLYVYLRHLLKTDADGSKLISGFKKEMDGIASIALKFLAKYENIGKEAALQNSFDDEFAVIGKVLGERIKREEATLYTLYIPPQ